MNIENGGPSEEELDPDGLTMEQRAEVEALLPAHEEHTRLQKESMENFEVEIEPEIAEFENLLKEFENRHSLSELNAITELKRTDAPTHPIREPARKDLIPILDALNALEHIPAVTKERHNELKAKYMALSKAVGIIEWTSGKVRH
jgi:hypothetical protein